MLLSPLGLNGGCLNLILAKAQTHCLTAFVTQSDLHPHLWLWVYRSTHVLRFSSSEAGVSDSLHMSSFLPELLFLIILCYEQQRATNTLYSVSFRLPPLD